MRAFSFFSTGFISLFVLFSLLGIPVTGEAAEESRLSSEDSAALKAAMTQLLRDNPELVLDVLRGHSEDVLEIAQQGNMQRKRKALIAQWEQDAQVAKKVNLDGHASRGPANAPVTIVAYSDFTCPFCRGADQVLNQVLSRYKNKVRLVFKPLPKEKVPVSLAAARYSLAAFMQDSDKGWDFYEQIFAGMENLEQDGENFLKATALRVGLDLKRLMADASGSKVQAMIDADRAEANTLQVPGTPYFLVNNLAVRGALPKELFEDAIDMALRLKK